MNWYKKAQVNLTENIAYDIYSKISNGIEGSWTIISDAKMMPTFKLESYRIIKLDGKDVKKIGDYFWVEVKIFIYKALNILHPWSGTYENAENWQQGVVSKLKDFGKYENFDWQEEETKRWEALKKLKSEDSSTYDEQYGNKLIEFNIAIYGKKPDGKPAPSSVNKLKLFFEKGDVEKIGVSDKGIDTPSDIARYVQTTIDNYYKNDNDENDRVEPIDPTGGSYIEPEVTYDQVDSPVFAPSLAQYKNWYKKAQQNYNKVRRKDYYKYHKDLLMGIRNEKLLNKMTIDLEEAIKYILTNSDMNQHPESVYRCPLCGDEESLSWFPGEDEAYGDTDTVSDLEMGHWECGSCGEKIGYEDYFQQSADSSGKWIYTEQGRSLRDALNKIYQAEDYEHKHMYFEQAMQFVHGSGRMSSWLIEGGMATIDGLRQGDNYELV